MKRQYKVPPLQCNISPGFADRSTPNITKIASTSMTQTALRGTIDGIENKENISDIVHRKGEVSSSPILKRPFAVVSNKELQSKYTMQEYVSPLKKRKTARLLHYQLSPPASPTLPSFPPTFCVKQEDIEEEIRRRNTQDNLEHVDVSPSTYENKTSVARAKEEEFEDEEQEFEEIGEDEQAIEYSEDEEQEVEYDEDEEDSDREGTIRTSRRKIKSTKNASKVYDSVKGTTCHQCKQKTMDRKTSCSRCANTTNSNIRGCFCGSCLRNRYGEDIDEVINNSSWVCPICRDVCNCSSCRRKACKNPVSITTREALKNDYKSVYHYLIDKKKKNSSIDI